MATNKIIFSFSTKINGNKLKFKKKKHDDLKLNIHRYALIIIDNIRNVTTRGV